MIKIAKTPLMMEGGEKVTDIKSLTENFYIGSVLSHFLSGRLEEWLKDRYYEEEAAAVAALSKEDTQLVEKMCEIFGVEYDRAVHVDIEDAVRRSERLSRLEWITDDREVIENVDFVAFDQEELAELYDQGAEKIYLCDGDFKVPASKSHLKYVLVGDVSVKGIPAPEPKAYDNLWRDICYHLDEQLSNSAMLTWFDNCEFVDFQNRTLTLRCSSEFRREVLRNVYCDYLQNALRKIYGNGEFEIVVLSDANTVDYRQDVVLT